MDNVNFHKSDSIKRLVNRKHHHTLLSTYSPFLNPIEFVFSRWKSLYKDLNHRTDDEVAEAIQVSSEQLHAKRITFLNCYNHTRKYFTRVLNFEDIDD